MALSQRCFIHTGLKPGVNEKNVEGKADINRFIIAAAKHFLGG